MNESTPPGDEKTIFDGIDTSFARLARAATPQVGAELATAQALLDSARAMIDLRRPDGVVRWLAHAAQLAQMARAQTPRCLFDVRSGQMAIGRISDDGTRRAGDCDAAALDLDASLSILAKRSAEAAFAGGRYRDRSHGAAGTPCVRRLDAGDAHGVQPRPRERDAGVRAS